MAHVFEKILGKKQKGLDIFILPEKKYCNDKKKINKMEKKDLLDQIENMEKYISTISNKLDQGKKEYEKTLNKLDQTTGKLTVLNQKMGMISNEHEELQVKFMNLQTSLQTMTMQKQTLYKKELQFIESRELSVVRVPDLADVLKIYREQIMLMDKITHQNKQLKQKYAQLETDFFNLSEKIAETKPKTQSKNNQLDIFREETEADDQKSNQQKLMLETKEQMIALLNKRIYEQEEKMADLNEKINDLKHEIEKKQTEIKQKEQYSHRINLQNSQNKQKIAQLKEFQEQLIIGEQNMKEDARSKALILEKMTKQITELKQKLLLSEEQKKILIGDHNNKIMTTDFQEKENELMKKKYEYQIVIKDRQIATLKSALHDIQKEKTKLQSLLGEYRSKQKEFLKIKDSLIEQTKKKAELEKRLQDEEESNQIKLKKLEFTANQERIKAEALKRSLTNLQLKQQQHRKQLDQMYEKKIVQDAKVAKMDNKLKSYKQMIQYLQKQKVQLERTFEDKMKNMEEMVVHEVDEEENQQQSQPSQRDIIEKDEALISKLRSRIVDLEEQIGFLKDENKILLDKRDELECSNLQLQKNYKAMNEKREQIAKQFRKMVSLENNSMPLKQTKQEDKNLLIPGRDKRIAQKALKGFDIFSKHLCTIYKQFLNVHICDIQKKQIKQLEGQINTLVGKCEDMKDVFQGYL